MQLIDASILKIVEYFDNLVNQIDISVENLFLKKHLSDELSLDQKKNSNSIRDMYINHINEIKNFNLQNSLQFQNSTECGIDNKDSSKLNYKFCFFIDNKLFNHYNEKLNKIGVLVVTDFYLSQAIINKLICIISEEWEFINGVISKPFLKSEQVLSKELIYSHEILKKIINRKDPNEIISISKKIDQPIRLRELVISKIEESLLDEFPIVELDIKYIDDLLSINKSSLKFNYTLEILQIKYVNLESSCKSRLSELSLENFKGLKKFHLFHRIHLENVQTINLREDFFAHLDNLEDLKISGLFPYKSSIYQLKGLNKLKKLSFDGVLARDNSKNCDTESSIKKIKMNDGLGSIFYDMVNLTKLELDECDISYLDLCFLSYLPNLEVLSLRDNFIIYKDIYNEQHVKPFKSLIKLKELDLSYNSLYKINSIIFEGLDNLEVLNLNFTDINKIDEHSFSHLKKLKTLDLSENFSIECHSNSFKGLESLENFYFESCLVSNMNIFDNMPNLKVIYIRSRGNEHYSSLIERLPERVFEGMFNLTSFGCGKKQVIVRDGSNSFKNFKNISELKINLMFQSQNDNENACRNFLHELTNLTKLTMTIEPQIETLHFSTFNSNFESLTSLYLNKIGVSHLEDGLFDRLENLKILSLKENNLRYLNGSRLFKNLAKLEHLDLESNHLKSISSFSFNSLTNLWYLNLLSNPLKNVEKNIFDKIGNLRELLIEIHDVSLSKECFKQLQKLNRLTINFQDTNLITKDIFTFLENLNNLTITGSCIYNITQDFLSHLRCLIYLCFENCPVANIHPRALENLKNLRVLKLNKLDIYEFDTRLIENLESLRVLELEENVYLEKIDFEEINNLAGLRRFVYLKNLKKSNRVNLVNGRYEIFKF